MPRLFGLPEDARPPSSPLRLLGNWVILDLAVEFFHCGDHGFEASGFFGGEVACFPQIVFQVVKLEFLQSGVCEEVPVCLAPPRSNRSISCPSMPVCRDKGF